MIGIFEVRRIGSNESSENLNLENQDILVL